MSFYLKVCTMRDGRPFFKIVSKDCLGEFCVIYHLPTICRLLNLTCEELESIYPQCDDGPALYPLYFNE